MMSQVTCPKCEKITQRAGYKTWQIWVSICFFPLGLLSLLAGRKPTICSNCNNTFTT